MFPIFRGTEINVLRLEEASVWGDDVFCLEVRNEMGGNDLQFQLVGMIVWESIR